MLQKQQFLCTFGGNSLLEASQMPLGRNSCTQMQGFMYFTLPPCILVQLLSIQAEVTLRNLLHGYTRTKMLPELHHKHIIPMPMHSNHQLAPLICGWGLDLGT